MPSNCSEGISADSWGFPGIPEEFHDYAEREGLLRINQFLLQHPLV